jgi:tRNA A-37 threonylcarbamoyl transferase component Bud32
MAELTKRPEGQSETNTVNSPPAAASGEALTVAGSAAPPPAAERPSVPGFEIVEELGRGGMGVVYKARQTSLNRFVALKMILAGPYAGAEHLARFKLEAEAVAGLDHPAIVRIHEIGSHDGRSYLALEYVPGGTLAERLRNGPLPPREAAGLVETLARAVHVAHRKGIVHRDLKPGNVLLTEEGAPKITDFGLAKRLEEEPGSTIPSPRTQSGAILGTPAYMAPEQAGGKGKTVGPATDVYALGAILYECLTGRPPFQADTPLDTILQVLDREPVPPGRLAPGCPRDLEAVCLKCLAKDPARRYASALDLAEDCAAFLRGEPTRARPATPAERLGRWLWRRKWWLAGGAAVAWLLLALGLSLALNALTLLLVGRENDNPPGGSVETGPGPEASEPVVALPADLDLVPRDASGFVTIHVAELWNRKDVQGLKELLAREKLVNADDEAADLEGFLGIRPEALERATFLVLEAERPEATWVAILATAEPFSRDALQARLEKLAFRPVASKASQGQTYFRRAGQDQGSVYPHGDRILVLSPRGEALEEWLGHVPPHDAGGPLRSALEEAARGRHHVVAGIAPSPKLRAALAGELKRDFSEPAARGKLTFPDLEPLQEAETAVLTADLDPSADGKLPGGFRFDVHVPAAGQGPNGRAHVDLTRLHDVLNVLVKLGTAGELDGLPPVIAQELAVALRTVRHEQRAQEGHFSLQMEWEPGWPAVAVLGLKENADRVVSRYKLKQLALALHGYHDTFGHFPPAALADKDGKPLLSWRVQVLPFLNEEPLFKEFRPDEPWDSEHNKKLLERMPAIFAPPGTPAGWRPNTTYYQVFVGEQTVFPPGKPLKLTDITDGTSNTLLVVEAGEAVPWTKPDDLPYDPNKPLPMLGGIFHDGFQAAFADGRSLRFLPKNADAKTLRALITARSGEIVDLP